MRKFLIVVALVVFGYLIGAGHLDGVLGWASGLIKTNYNYVSANAGQ